MRRHDQNKINICANKCQGLSICAMAGKVPLCPPPCPHFRMNTLICKKCYLVQCVHSILEYVDDDDDDEQDFFKFCY